MVTDKEKIHALKLARVLVADHLDRGWEDNFICVALVKIRQQQQISREVEIHLKSYIEKQLGTKYGVNTLDAWQSRNGHYVKGMQTARDRLAWIDWMIDQLENH